jgi:hypothetical protein
LFPGSILSLKIKVNMLEHYILQLRPPRN